MRANRRGQRTSPHFSATAAARPGVMSDRNRGGTLADSTHSTTQRSRLPPRPARAHNTPFRTSLPALSRSSLAGASESADSSAEVSTRSSEVSACSRMSSRMCCTTAAAAPESAGASGASIKFSQAFRLRNLHSVLRHTLRNRASDDGEGARSQAPAVWFRASLQETRCNEADRARLVDNIVCVGALRPVGTEPQACSEAGRHKPGFAAGYGACFTL